MIELVNAKVKNKKEELYEYLKDKELLLAYAKGDSFYTIMDIKDDVGIEGLIDYMWIKGLYKVTGIGYYEEYRLAIENGEIFIGLHKDSLELLQGE